MQSFRTSANFRRKREEESSSWRRWRLSGSRRIEAFLTGRLDSYLTEVTLRIVHGSHGTFSVLISPFVLQEEAVEPDPGAFEEVSELPRSPEQHHTESRADHR